MDRRQFISVAGLSLLTTPGAAHAQAGKVARIVVLSPGEKPTRFLDVFRQALRERGWVEGENLKLEVRLGGEDYTRLRALADEAVRTNPDVIVAASAPAAQAAKAATTTIPVVFHTLNDPVRTGLVASFGRPGGNLTGNAGLGPELDRKRLELLKEVVPGLTRVAVLLNPGNLMTPPRVMETEESARVLKVEVSVLKASSGGELDRALEAIGKSRPGGVVLFDDPIFFFHRTRIIAAMAKYQIPAVYSQWGWVQQGAFMEYAPNQLEMYRQVASYVDRILRGTKPADLPIEQPTKFELAINVKTAKALGLTIPQTLLQRADQLIE